MKKSSTSYKTNESGKTLLEVIRILMTTSGIILLLFFGIRWGYRQLMYYQQGSDTISELSKRAVLFSGQMLSGKTSATQEEFGAFTKQGYGATVQLIDDSFFEIALIGVPAPVCRRIIKTKWTIPVAIYINTILADNNPDLCGDSQSLNKMSFEFNRELRSHMSNADKPRNRHCLNDNDCDGGCQTCQAGLCRSACPRGESCATTLNGDKICCADKNITEGICCSFIDEGECCFDRNKCCPMETPLWQEGGFCTDCYSTDVIALGSPPSADICQKVCPDRVPFGSDGLCMLPICGSNQLTGRLGGCVSCDLPGGIPTSASECAKCSGRVFRNGLCQKPCPLDTVMDERGRCRPCSDTAAFTPDMAGMCSKTCPGRIMKDERCVLKTCPPGFTPDEYGSCLDCNTDETLPNVSAADCMRCPGRHIVGLQGCVKKCPDGQFQAQNGLCHSCDDPLAIDVFGAKDECLKCPDRLMLGDYCFALCGPNQFRDANGACRNCSDMDSYPVPDSNSCLICPNRRIVLIHTQETNKMYCAPQHCPFNYFIGKTGACYDCFGEPTIVSGISELSCRQCANRIFSPVNATCLIPQNCQPSDVLDTHGACHACDSDEEAFQIDGHLQECDKCANRYLYGYWCRKCPQDVTSLNNKAACMKCGGAWDNRIARCQKNL